MQKKLNQLTVEEEKIIIHKGTEAPFSGEYNNFSGVGIFLCKQCDSPLFNSQTKFSSHCGWPAFDAEIPGRVMRVLDADGYRVEIVCSQCGGHLGHVFEGEQLTENNVRHCVNSLSIKFVPAEDQAIYAIDEQVAYYAGGCFWGVEHLLQNQLGVLSVTSGYMGGRVENPTYEQVCSKNTGHLEAVAVTYNPALISYERLTKFFFEIHDPTQVNGQGPDIGPQYASAVFYSTEEEASVVSALITQLEKQGLDIATKLLPVSTFWPAEEYHQDYYNRNGKVPYCHRYTKRF